MFSLFISFDSMINVLNPFMGFSMYLVFFFYQYSNFYLANSFRALTFKFMNFVLLEVKTASKINSSLVSLGFLSLFFFLLLLNLSGMLIFGFTLGSHLFFCFFFSLLFWLSIFVFSVYNDSLNYFSHLVPLGSPLILSQFMVLIESISQIIRPLTLAVRLMANLTAGHLILILCSSSPFLLGISSLPLFLLIFLEIGVALIQSYVFVILLSMYYGEFNN